MYITFDTMQTQSMLQFTNKVNGKQRSYLIDTLAYFGWNTGFFEFSTYINCKRKFLTLKYDPTMLFHHFLWNQFSLLADKNWMQFEEKQKQDNQIKCYWNKNGDRKRRRVRKKGGERDIPIRKPNNAEIVLRK